MKVRGTLRKVVIGVAALLVLSTSSAMAAFIDWNTWTSNSTGVISTASGPVNVSYLLPAPLTSAAVFGYPTYTPAGTFADGVYVENAPTSANNIMQVTGGLSLPNLIHFSRPVEDPVFAIWSLGQALAGNAPVDASFNFLNALPIFVAGGPSAEYAGNPISVTGPVVHGLEANGTVRFEGTFTDILWENPVYEYWYGFNVGAPAPVPEPGTVLLLATGMLGVAIWRKRRAAV